MTFKQGFLIGFVFIITILFVIIPALCLEDTAANPITYKRIVKLYAND